MIDRFFETCSPLHSALDRVLAETFSAFPQLAPNQIAVTWLLHDPPYRINTGGALSAEEFWQYKPNGASYRGVELMPPVGLVTLFYMVAMQVWLDQGMAQPSAEIDRAIAHMITNKDMGINVDATSYIVDLLSGTTSGPELSEGPNGSWQHQRNIVNRYYQQLGWPELRGINLNQKLWCNGPYGREHDFLGEGSDNQNLLSSDAISRLLHSIIGGVSVSSVRSQEMMKLLKRTDNVLPANVWSLTNHTERVSALASYVESDLSHPYQLVVLVERKGAESAQQNKEITSFVARRVFEITQQDFLKSV